MRATDSARRVDVLGRRLNPRANSLNFLRLVMAVLVIVSHAWSLGGIGPEPSPGGHTLGTWSVYGFFALSGYLITGSRLNNDLTTYLKRRILRIYPGFVVCLLVTVIVVAPIGYVTIHHTLAGYATTPTTPLDYVVGNIGLKMNVFHIAGTPTNEHAWTSTLWTLYYEFGCYLIIGALGMWTAFRRRPAVAVTLLALVTVLQLHQETWGRLSQAKDVPHMMELLPYFLAGTVLYLLRARVPCTWWAALAATVALVGVPAVLGNSYTPLCAIPLAMILLYLGAVVPVRLGRTNDISYGIYMYGGAVQQLLRLTGLPDQGATLYILASVAGTVPLAVASWFLVERPAMGRRPRIAIRPPEPAPQLAQVG